MSRFNTEISQKLMAQILSVDHEERILVNFKMSCNLCNKFFISEAALNRKLTQNSQATSNNKRQSFEPFSAKRVIGPSTLLDISYLPRYIITRIVDHLCRQTNSAEVKPEIQEHLVWLNLTLQKVVHIRMHFYYNWSVHCSKWY